MIFSSVLFLFRFLPIFLTLYFLTYLCPAARRIRNVLLFLGSLFFYAWGEPVYVLLLLFSTLSDYIHGLLIDRYRGGLASKLFLVSSVIINLAVLGFFKYADWIIGAINQLTGAGLSYFNLPLPIGISFYTFQTMSYTIDVYREKAKVQKSLLDFAVFVTMFPQLIAGPIVRYRDIQDQLHDRDADPEAASYGCRRFCVGLAKKVLLANQLGLLWEEVLSRQGEMSVLTAWIGVVAFAFQIYFDFSGYSDMAIGLGAMLGFRFPENFHYPYLAGSITDFWRRWHMTLSRWFRDYVYIPLGGNRKGSIRQIFNILLVWALTGIWHGANWNFLLWGLWFALFLILEKLFLGQQLKKLPALCSSLYTIFVVLIGWAIFAIEDCSSLWSYLQAMFGIGASALYDTAALYFLREYAVLLVLAAIASTPIGSCVAEGMKSHGSSGAIITRRLLEKVVLAVLLLASIAYIVEASYNPFLYFRF